MTLEWYSSNFPSLTLLPENIKQWVTIFDVDGTFNGSGIGNFDNTVDHTMVIMSTYDNQNNMPTLNAVHNWVNYLFAVWSMYFTLWYVWFWIYAIEKSTWKIHIFQETEWIIVWWFTIQSLSIDVDDTLGKVRIWWEVNWWHYTYYDFSTNTIWTSSWTYVAPTVVSPIYGWMTFTMSIAYLTNSSNRVRNTYLDITV